jgi:hypothetical protein
VSKLFCFTLLPFLSAALNFMSKVGCQNICIPASTEKRSWEHALLPFSENSPVHIPSAQLSYMATPDCKTDLETWLSFWGHMWQWGKSQQENRKIRYNFCHIMEDNFRFFECCLISPIFMFNTISNKGHKTERKKIRSINSV